MCHPLVFAFFVEPGTMCMPSMWHHFVFPSMSSSHIELIPASWMCYVLSFLWVFQNVIRSVEDFFTLLFLEKFEEIFQMLAWDECSSEKNSLTLQTKLKTSFLGFLHLMYFSFSAFCPLANFINWNYSYNVYIYYNSVNYLRQRSCPFWSVFL